MTGAILLMPFLASAEPRLAAALNHISAPPLILRDAIAQCVPAVEAHLRRGVARIGGPLIPRRSHAFVEHHA